MRCETGRPLIAVVSCAQFSLQEEPFDCFTFQLSAIPSTLRSKERHLLHIVSDLHVFIQGNFIPVFKRWLRHCATSRRVPGSIPGHWGFFPGHQTVPCALGVDSVSKNECQDIPGGKDGRWVRVKTLPHSCVECLEILEP